MTPNNTWLGHAETRLTTHKRAFHTAILNTPTSQLDSMLLGRRKKPAAIALLSKTITRAAKRVRLKSLLPSARKEAILAASSKSHHSAAESILIDTEDESMDSGSENDYPPTRCI